MKTRLSKKQLQVLGALSNRAYNALLRQGCVCERYDDWRRSYTALVTGCTSWRALYQHDYIPLVNALRSLIGLRPVADHTPLNPASSLAWTIKDRCAFWELSIPYVATIVANKFHCPQALTATTWDDLLRLLDTAQLKQLIYTIEARGRARENKSAAQHNLPIPTELHASPATMPPPRLAKWRGDQLVTPISVPATSANQSHQPTA